MKILSYLLFIAAAIACTGLSGCGAAPAQIPLQIEQEAGPVSFVHNHSTGLELARRDNKPTLIFFSVPENVGSQRMMKTTFCNDEIKRLAERFICIHVDGSQEMKLCESLEITSFPTILLSNAYGSETRRLVGKQTSDQLAVQMHVVLQTTALNTANVR